ncbi:aminopeptidase [candidate division KSB1 bacterium]|nr:aminopeptidase [candidate division KSB1 bacterium]
MLRTLKLRDLNPEYLHGAYNAVRNCLRIQPHEHVTLITDYDTLDIAKCLFEEVQQVGSPVTAFVLENLTARPMRKMPSAVLAAMSRSHVGIMCVKSQVGEAKVRGDLIQVVEQHGVRYAHMIGITSEIMLQSMRADFDTVYALGDRLLAVARPAQKAYVKTALGTDMVVTLSRKLRWQNTGGKITSEVWSNLPAGEIFTCPESVEGVMVVDGTVGDYLCWKYGCIENTPLHLEISGGYLQSARCDNAELQREFSEYCNAGKNSDRVGEFALGTNLWVEGIIGNLLQDEKMPGAHIAFGNPAPGQTGADWTCPTHIDLITLKPDIWFDDVQVMARGEYLV